MIDLSVVVLSYETRDLVLACLRDLEAELTRCRLEEGITSELIVVDNGSRDGSVEAIRRTAPGHLCLALPRNLGFAGGMNAGVARARGRVLLLMNSDARATRGAIARCLGALDARPDAAVAGPELRSPSDRPQRSVHRFPSLVTELVPTRLRALVRPSGADRVPAGSSVPVAVDAVRGAAFFVRRAAFDRFGPLDDGYFFFLEETDFCWRVRQGGASVLYVPGARFEHVLGASSKHVAPAATRIEYHRSLYRFVRSWRGAASMRAVIAIRFGRALGTGLLLSALAPFSLRQRRRLAERVVLLKWHLTGCPEDAGLAGRLPEQRGSGTFLKNAS